MGKWARIALVSALIFSIAYILITPDTSDDVDGILRLNNPSATVQKLSAVSLSHSQPLVLAEFGSLVTFSPPPHLGGAELLVFASVIRC